jgi:6,7-dimethyl-8-ribityllumazine synthase
MAKFLIVEARFYAHLNDMLISGARRALEDAGHRGETYHFEIVAGESARGIMALTIDSIAVGNGILTVENEAQAIVRADPHQGNKGAGAAEAAMALLALQETFA